MISDNLNEQLKNYVSRAKAIDVTGIEDFEELKHLLAEVKGFAFLNDIDNLTCEQNRGTFRMLDKISKNTDNEAKRLAIKETKKRIDY